MKNKLKNIYENNKFVVLTALLATIIFIIIYIIKSIIPFGKNTMLTVDFYHQYGPLLSELYDRIKSGSSLKYSFATGLGLPFFRNFYNYLSSPFNVLLFLFKRDNIVTAFSFIIAAKVIVACTTMSYSLKRIFNKHNILITIFGLSYGMSSYFVAFYWNIMWLDGLIYLPLITLGIKELVDNNKFNLYIISLSISIISNYFISYMLCIYSCLFFFIYIMFYEKITRKDLIKKIGLFTISSLISGGITAYMLLPYISSLSSISATGDAFYFYKTWNFNPLFFLANNYSSVNSIVFSSQDYFLPNISSGILVFFLTILFFINKDIRLKHKIMALIFIVIFFFSFIFVPVDFMWHGFHTPNDLPFRYSFILIFILNVIAFYSASKIKKLNIYLILIPAVILYVFAAYLYSISFLSYGAFMINLILLTSILIAIFLLNKKDLFLNLLFLLVTIIDIILNINNNWNIDHDKQIFMDDYVKVNYVIDKIKNDDKSVYRIEKGNNQTLNDGAWYNYYGLSIFSSVAYEQMAKTQKKLGMPGNDVNSYYYKKNTPIYNSIMGIKYLVNTTEDSPYYRYIDEINMNNIYLNEFSLPFLFATSNDLKYWNCTYKNVFLNQEEFVSLSTGIRSIFDKLEFIDETDEEEMSKYSLSNDQIYNNVEDNYEINLKINPLYDGNVYLYLSSYNLEHFMINDNYQFITTNEPYILDIGYYKKDEEINLTIPINKDIYYIDIYAYQMNDEKFKNFYRQLNDESINLTKFSEDCIEGSIDVKENKMIFSSISYDEGFKVFVDGKEVNTYKVANSFLGFDIESGKHNIKIYYKVPKRKIGIILSIISLTLLITMNFFKKKKH